MSSVKNKPATGTLFSALWRHRPALQPPLRVAAWEPIGRRASRFPSETSRGSTRRREPSFPASSSLETGWLNAPVHKTPVVICILQPVNITCRRCCSCCLTQSLFLSSICLFSVSCSIHLYTFNFSLSLCLTVSQLCCKFSDSSDQWCITIYHNYIGGMISKLDFTDLKATNSCSCCNNWQHSLCPIHCLLFVKGLMFPSVAHPAAANTKRFSVDYWWCHFLNSTHCHTHHLHTNQN